MTDKAWQQNIGLIGQSNGGCSQVIVLEKENNITMYERCGKVDFEPDGLTQDSAGVSKENVPTKSRLSKENLRNVMKFVLYCTMLIVPLYAITMSVIKHDWLMVMIDALIVPIGFVHGILLLTGLIA
jgi:hypothetical protein